MEEGEAEMEEYGEEGEEEMNEEYGEEEIEDMERKSKASSEQVEGGEREDDDIGGQEKMLKEINRQVELKTRELEESRRKVEEL
jgi:hypothetical protein